MRISIARGGHIPVLVDVVESNEGYGLEHLVSQSVGLVEELATTEELTPALVKSKKDQ